MLDGTKLHCLGWWALGPTARAPVGEVAVWEGFFSTNWRPGVELAMDRENGTFDREKAKNGLFFAFFLMAVRPSKIVW